LVATFRPFLLAGSHHPRALPSFPTRRSSDLAHPPLVVPLMVAPLPRDEQPLSPGGSPYPCGCLLRPCTHDQPTCRTTGQYDATDPTDHGRRRYKLYDPDDKPFTERLLREYRARQARYDDEPPF